MDDVYSRFELTKGNHLRYWFGKDQSQHWRSTPDDVANMSVGGLSDLKTLGFIDSLMETSRSLAAPYGNNFHLFLSGGLDSEIALRVFTKAKVPVKIVVVRFDDDHNAPDVNSAMRLCNMFGLTPIVIDLSPIRFLESGEWARIAADYQVHTFYQQMLMHVAEKLAVPMITIDEIEIIKGKDGWIFIKKEDQDGSWHRFIERTSIPAYNNFYTYDPRSITSFMSSPRIKSLISNQVVGKLGWASSKNEVYFELTRWTMHPREKITGLEKLMHVWEYVEHETRMLIPGPPRIFSFDASTLQTNLRNGDNLTCSII